MDKKEEFVHALLIGFTLGGQIVSAFESQNMSALLIPGFSTIFGITAWISIKIITTKMTTIFFYIQKISLFHLVFKLKMFNDENYFLTSTPKN